MNLKEDAVKSLEGAFQQYVQHNAAIFIDLYTTAKGDEKKIKAALDNFINGVNLAKASVETAEAKLNNGL